MKLISAAFSILVVTATQSVQSAHTPATPSNTPTCKDRVITQTYGELKAKDGPDCDSGDILCRIFDCFGGVQVASLPAIKQEM